MWRAHPRFVAIILDDWISLLFDRQGQLSYIIYSVFHNQFTSICDYSLLVQVLFRQWKEFKPVIKTPCNIFIYPICFNKEIQIKLTKLKRVIAIGFKRNLLTSVLCLSWKVFDYESRKWSPGSSLLLGTWYLKLLAQRYGGRNPPVT